MNLEYKASPQKPPEEPGSVDRRGRELRMAIFAALASVFPGVVQPATAARTTPESEAVQRDRDAKEAHRKVYFVWIALRQNESVAFKALRESVGRAKKKALTNYKKAQKARQELERKNGNHILMWLQMEFEERDAKTKDQRREERLAESIVERMIGILLTRDKLIDGMDKESLETLADMYEVGNEDAGEFPRARHRLKMDELQPKLKEIFSRFLELLGSRFVLDRSFWKELKEANYSTLYQHMYQSLWPQGRIPLSRNELERIYELLTEIESLSDGELKEILIRLQLEQRSDATQKPLTPDDTETL